MAKAMQYNGFWTPMRLLSLAARFQKDGEAEKGLTTLAMLTELAPENAEGHFQLGNALQAGGNRTEARAAYERALAAKPDHGGATKALAELE